MLSAFFVVSLHLILFSLASGLVQTSCYSVQTTCYSMKHISKNRPQTSDKLRRSSTHLVREMNQNPG